jgi:hypothetical protein
MGKEDSNIHLYILIVILSCIFSFTALFHVYAIYKSDQQFVTNICYFYKETNKSQIISFKVVYCVKPITFCRGNKVCVNMLFDMITGLERYYGQMCGSNDNPNRHNLVMPPTIHRYAQDDIITSIITC